jgi:two-component system response regulator AtoC
MAKQPSDQETLKEANRPALSTTSGWQLHVMGRGHFQTLTLPPAGRWVIGRGEGCELRLEDPAISRQHAALIFGQGVTLEDSGSANGTFLEGRKIGSGERALVKPGEVVELGAFTLTLTATGGTELRKRLWPAAYFEHCVAEECAKNREPGLVLVRLRLSRPVEREELGLILNVDLRAEELAADLGGGEVDLLLLGRTPELAREIVRNLKKRLEAAGAGPILSALARHPEDGARPELLFGKLVRGLLGQEDEAPRGELIVVDPAMIRLHRLVDRVAGGKINVLILGETGTGKELIAQRLHQRSPRAEGPFVKLNCAALPEALIESELFGYEKAAFTGADRPKPGLIETAHGGTLFLDEVGELSLPIQAKLLRVLEERVVQRLGALRPKPVDLRLVSATNRDLQVECGRGAFREDLYFRLNGIAITVPPLRERPADLRAMIDHFAQESARQADQAEVHFGPEALALMLAHPWPGNVRELKNAVDRAVLLAAGETIEPEHLPLAQMKPKAHPAAPSSSGGVLPLEASVQAHERAQIVEALAACDGNQTKAAKRLGISRRTLINRLEQYRIERPRKRADDDDDGP